MGERTESSDEKSKPLKKKLKLSVPKDKEWQFVDDAPEAAFGKQFVPKYTATSTKWAVLIDLCCLEKWAKRSRSNP